MMKHSEVNQRIKKSQAILRTNLISLLLKKAITGERTGDEGGDPTNTGALSFFHTFKLYKTSTTSV